MSTDLIREDPPSRAPSAGRKHGPFTLWLVELRQHPGEWFRYPEPHGQANASTLVNRGNKAIKPGEFELRSAPCEHGAPSHRTIYARYIGGEA